MLDLHNNRILPGNRVVLASPGGYVIGLHNPATGTQYECEGTFVGNTTVLWDNGTKNTYSDFTLQLLNIYASYGKCESMWPIFKF